MEPIRHQVGNASIICSDEVRKFNNVIISRHGIVLDEQFHRVPNANQQFNFWSTLWAAWWEPARWLPEDMLDVPFKPIVDLPEQDYIYALFYQDRTAFGHFWDILQSLHSVEQEEIQGTLLCHYQTDVNDIDFHWTAFGYPAERRLSLDTIKYNYFVPTLYVPDVPVPPAQIHVDLKDWLLNKYLDAVPKDPGIIHKRLYLSRSTSAKRRVQNESELLPLLKAYNFTILYGNESIQEHINYFRSARVVVGCLGSLLRNIFFCQKSPHVLEYCSSQYTNDPSIQQLGELVGIKNYRKIVLPDAGDGDVIIDPDQLEQTLVDLDLRKTI
jgi:hypothetical protein